MYNDYMDNLFDRKQEDITRQVMPPMPFSQPSSEVGKIYIYDVRRGDNVYTIAKRFNTTADLIRHMNQLGPHASLQPRQQLLIPVLHKQSQPQPLPQKPYPMPMPPPQPQPYPMPSPRPQSRQSYDLYF